MVDPTKEENGQMSDFPPTQKSPRLQAKAKAIQYNKGPPAFHGEAEWSVRSTYLKWPRDPFLEEASTGPMMLQCIGYNGGQDVRGAIKDYQVSV